jgi:hypothetical protein
MSRFINLKEFSHNLVKDIFSIKKMDNKDNRDKREREKWVIGLIALREPR